MRYAPVLPIRLPEILPNAPVDPVMNDPTLPKVVADILLPTNNAPPIPTPPVTINAPVEVDVELLVALA